MLVMLGQPEAGAQWQRPRGYHMLSARKRAMEADAGDMVVMDIVVDMDMEISEKLGTARNGIIVFSACARPIFRV